MTLLRKYPQHELISVKLPANTGGIIPIWEGGLAPDEQELREAGYKVISNVFISSLRLKTRINSLNSIDVPEIQPLASSFQINKEFRVLEWQNSRKHLNFYIRASSSKEWHSRATISLLNRDDLPYYDSDGMSYFGEQLAIPLGETNQIGVNIEDVGWGVLSPTDEVLLYANVLREVRIYTAEIQPELEEITECISYGWTIGSQSAIILQPNPNRKQVTLTNNYNSDIYISLGLVAEWGKGIFLKGQGGTYEHNKINPKWKGAISAISLPGGTLSGIECI